MTNASSWQNSEPLPCFILCSKAQTCLLLPVLVYLCIPVPCDEKNTVFGVLVLESLVVFPEPFSFFSINGRGIDLGLL